MGVGWIVLISLLILLAGLLLFPIRIALSYSDAGFQCRIKLLFWSISLFPRPEKPLDKEGKTKKAGKQEDQSARKKSKKEKKKAQSKERSLKELLHLIKILLDSAGKIARRFWKGFVIDHLTLHMAVAGADAADTAISYGKINAQIYTAYSFLMQFVTLRNTDIRIVPDFLSTESTLEASCELFFRIGTLLAAGLAGIWQFLKLLIKDKSASIREREEACV